MSWMFYGTSGKQLREILKALEVEDLLLVQAEEEAWDLAERQALVEDDEPALLVLDATVLPGRWIGLNYIGPMPLQAVLRAVIVEDEGELDLVSDRRGSNELRETFLAIP